MSTSGDMPLTHTSEVRAADDVRFRVATNPDDRDDPVSEELRAGSFPVARLFDLVRRIVPAGGRIVDLGAHVGSFSLACAAAGYDVLCAEASPANAALIQASIALNGFANLRLFNVAVSDREGRLRFHPQGPFGHVAPDGYDGTTVDVEAITVDELLARAGWDRADFIKLDIEGSEVAALRGMRRVLGGETPPFVFCESNGHMLHKFGDSPQSLKAALAAHRLRVYAVTPTQLVPVAEREPQGLTVLDYFAARALPDALGGEVAPAIASPQDHVRDLRISAQSPVLEERWYAARTLQQSREYFAGEPEAEAIRSRLAQDPASLVKQVALQTPPIGHFAMRWLRRIVAGIRRA